MLPNLSESEHALYSQILQSIAEMRLLPGRKLTEEKLAEAFDVSRATVRQVLLLLEADGIVSRRRNKGAFIRFLSPEEAAEVFDARRVIELHLVNQAIDRATRKDISDLRNLLERECTALDTDDFAASARLSGEFHLQLASISGHQTLLSVLQSLIVTSYLAVALYKKRAGTACARDDHGVIVDKLEAGDKQGLTTEMARHFDHILAEMDFSVQETRSPLQRFLSE